MNQHTFDSSQKKTESLWIYDEKKMHEENKQIILNIYIE